MGFRLPFILIIFAFSMSLLKKQTESYLFSNTTTYITLFYRTKDLTLIQRVLKEDRTVCFFSEPNYSQ